MSRTRTFPCCKNGWIQDIDYIKTAGKLVSVYRQPYSQINVKTQSAKWRHLPPIETPELRERLKRIYQVRR